MQSLKTAYSRILCIFNRLNNYQQNDDLGVTQYNAVGYISLSGKLSNIGEWVKNNGTPGKCTFVRVEPSDSDGYFGTSGFSILWMRTSVNYGWCILISDDPKMVVLGSEFHWMALVCAVVDRSIIALYH